MRIRDLENLQLDKKANKPDCINTTKTCVIENKTTVPEKKDFTNQDSKTAAKYVVSATKQIDAVNDKTDVISPSYEDIKTDERGKMANDRFNHAINNNINRISDGHHKAVSADKTTSISAEAEKTTPNADKNESFAVENKSTTIIDVTREGELNDWEGFDGGSERNDLFIYPPNLKELARANNASKSGKQNFYNTYVQRKTRKKIVHIRTMHLNKVPMLDVVHLFIQSRP